MQHLSPEKCERINATLGEFAGDKHLKNIDMLIDAYLEKIEADVTHPRTYTGLKAEREQIQAAAGKAKEALHELATILEDASPWAHADIGNPDLGKGIWQTIEGLKLIDEMLQGSEKFTKPPKTWHRFLLRMLMFTWQETTGREPTVTTNAYGKPPSGDFLEFVLACVDDLPGFKGDSRETVSGAIKRVKRQTTAR